MRRILVRFVPGLVGACLGGLIGYFIVRWIKSQGYYAPVIPGAFAGLACGFCSVDHSRIRGALCALIALSASMVTEWLLFLPPVRTDGSLAEFIACFPKQQPITLITVGLGTFLGFWWGRETTFPWRHRIGRPNEASGPDLD